MAPPKKLVTTEDTADEATSTLLSSSGDDSIAATGESTTEASAGPDSISGGAGEGPFNGADPAKFDHDGDGKPGGSLQRTETAPAPMFTMDEVRSMIVEAVGAALAAQAPQSEYAVDEPDEDDANDQADISALEPGAVVTRGAPPPRPKAGPGSDMVLVRITKTGHGQVHTGATGTGVKKTYDWRDEVALPREIGQALEERSYGEILE